MGAARIVHDGTSRTLDEWERLRRTLHGDERAALEAMVRDGDIFDERGERLTGAPLKRMRHRLLGTYEGLPGHGAPPVRQQRWLVPGLMRWGTIPSLAGTSKAGKSTLVVDFAAALVRPGYRFLGHFEPVEGMRLTAPGERWDPEHDLGRGVTVVNTENPPADFEAVVDALIPRDLDPIPYRDGTPSRIRPRDLLRIIHADDLGGPAGFDLTDPEVYERWVYLLGECNDCDGTDDWSSFAVIADGVTGALGNDTSRYGAWQAAYKRLLRECAVPNGLGVLHSTIQGNHAMGGVSALAPWDGLWNLSADQDNATSKRWFRVQPRLGGVVVPPTEVRLDEGGRPLMVALPRVAGRTAAAPEPPAEDVSEAVDPVLAMAHRIADYVAAHPGAHGQELTDEVEAPSKRLNLQGRERAVEEGLVRSEPCSRGCAVCGEAWFYKRTHYWPADRASGPVPPAAT